MRKHTRSLSLLLATLLLFAAVSLFPSNAQTALGPGWYDDDFFLIAYTTGSWTSHASEAVCVDGTRSWSNTASATVEITFWGDGFTIFSLANSTPVDRGMLVCAAEISGCTFHSTYNAGGLSNLEIEYTGFGYGTHDIVIMQAESTLNFCGILIHPPADQPTLEPQEIVIELTVPPLQVTFVPGDVPHRDTWEIDGQDVAFDYLFTSGDLFIVVLLSVVVLFAFVFFIMRSFGMGGRKREL